MKASSRVRREVAEVMEIFSNDNNVYMLLSKAFSDCINAYGTPEYREVCMRQDKLWDIIYEIMKFLKYQRKYICEEIRELFYTSKMGDVISNIRCLGLERKQFNNCRTVQDMLNIKKDRCYSVVAFDREIRFLFNIEIPDMGTGAYYQKVFEEIQRQKQERLERHKANRKERRKNKRKNKRALLKKREEEH